MKMMEEEIKALKEERDLWINETFQLRTLKEVLTAKTHAAETEMMLAVTNLKAANDLNEKLKKKVEIREKQSQFNTKLLKQLLSENEDYDEKVAGL